MAQTYRGLKGQREKWERGWGWGIMEEQVVFQSKNRYNCYRRIHSVPSIVEPFFMLSHCRS